MKRRTPRCFRASRRHVLTERLSRGPAAYAVGITAARLLHTHYPDFFAAHVADRRLTPQTMLGAAQAFFGFLTREIEIYEPFMMEYGRLYGDPRALLDYAADSDGAALDILADELCNLIDCPMITVYGLVGGLFCVEAEVDDIAWNVLVLGLCQIAEGTAWTIPDVIAFISENEEVPAVLETLPRLPARTPMGRLCVALDVAWQPTDLWPPLGSLMRFVFAQTGNEFADYATEEIMDMYESGNAITSLFDLDLGMVAEEQRIAREWRRMYNALNDLVRDRPDLLTTIATAILAVAQTLQESPDGTTDIPLDTMPPLAAPSPAAVPA